MPRAVAMFGHDLNPHYFANPPGFTYVLHYLFALAYGVVRTAHIALFMLASREDGELRHSVLGLAVSSLVAVSLLTLASLFDGLAQGALWALALLLDMGGPYFFGSEGWKLMPGHFAERHGLIVIIALGESIVAIGVGAGIDTHLDAGTTAAAVLGVALTAAMWWAYFDIVSIINTRRLAEAEVGRVQNELARDAYSYIHLPMVAGIILVALGLKMTLADHGAHAGAGDAIDRDFQLFKNLENADVRHAARAAAG